LIRSVLYSVPSPHCLCNAFVTTWALTPPHYLSLVPAPPNLLRFQLLADHWGNLNSTVHLILKGKKGGEARVFPQCVWASTCGCPPGCH
jgi:hypothetical protein